MHRLRPHSLVVGIVASLVLAAWGSADAQMRPASAEIIRANGRVEVLPKGQTNWTAGTVGVRLVEGDQIRAMAASAADLTLPDGSTILIAENTRFAVQKLDYDTASRGRDATFHVVAGKVRAPRNGSSRHSRRACWCGPPPAQRRGGSGLGRTRARRGSGP
jgi:hypothetical protein